MVSQIFDTVTNKIVLYWTKFQMFLYEKFKIGYGSEDTYWFPYILLFLVYLSRCFYHEYRNIENVDSYSKIQLVKLIAKKTIKSAFRGSYSQGSNIFAILGIILMAFILSVTIFNGLRKHW